MDDEAEALRRAITETFESLLEKRFYRFEGEHVQDAVAEGLGHANLCDLVYCYLHQMLEAWEVNPDLKDPVPYLHVGAPTFWSDVEMSQERRDGGVCRTYRRKD